MKVIDWILGISLWVARLVERLIKWGLSGWAYGVGILCVGLVLILHWVALTISNKVSGLHAPLFGYSRTHPANPLLSWGVLVALLFVVAAWSYSRKHWRILSLAGAVLLLTCLCGLLQVAYGEPVLLKQLVDEETDWVEVQKFQTRFLPTMLRVEESNSKGPQMTESIETIWDRLVVARYFMGMGWYLTVIVGLSCFFYARPRLSVQDRSRVSKGVLLMAACLASAFTVRSAMAHFLVSWGQTAEASGHPDVAIGRYRRAMRLDRWFAIHTTLYERIGAIDAAFGRSATLEYGLYRCQQLFAQKNFTEAIAELQRLIPKSGNQAPVLLDKEAQMWADYGGALYSQHAIAAAIPAWESALAKNPGKWMANFGLSRAYFEMGRYDEVVTSTQRMLKEIRDPALIAELDSNLGDAFTRLGKLAQAHIAYRTSYMIDLVYNWRGLSGTVGSQNEISLEDSDAGNVEAKKP